MLAHRVAVLCSSVGVHAALRCSGCVLPPVPSRLRFATRSGTPGTPPVGRSPVPAAALWVRPIRGCALAAPPPSIGSGSLRAVARFPAARGPLRPVGASLRVKSPFVFRSVSGPRLARGSPRLKLSGRRPPTYALGWRRRRAARGDNCAAIRLRLDASTGGAPEERSSGAGGEAHVILKDTASPSSRRRST